MSFQNIFSLNTQDSHPHGCLIFDDFRYYRKVAIDFIADGLCAKEKCIMAVDSYHYEIFQEDFHNSGVDLDAVQKSGKLSIFTKAFLETKSCCNNSQNIRCRALK